MDGQAFIQSSLSDDPDPPDPATPRMVWVHWVLFNIPPFTTGLSEGERTLPAGTGEGLNDLKRAGYNGPAPPQSASGDRGGGND